MTALETRRERLYDWMAQEGVSLLMFEDVEGRRDSAIQWLTGQPGDSLLFLSVDKQAILVPWDINIARMYADIDAMVAYTDFERHPIKALKAVADYLKTPHGSKIEIPSVTPYPIFLQYVEQLRDFDVLCRMDGIGNTIAELRAIKDEDEIRIYRQASAITNEIIDLLEKEFQDGSLKTETDVALFIEAAARSRGCEGTGFETLAAGPNRSFGIHAYPSFTAETFASEGLSILDFGLKYHGYTTDVTLTIAKGSLSRTQQRLLNLVEKAYNTALSLVQEEAPTRELALAVDSIFSKAKQSMPHALGHGIGLEAHEGPMIRTRADNQWRLSTGMVFTLEPGLYNPTQGGCRLENDILLTETGPEVLTRAHIIRL